MTTLDINREVFPGLFPGGVQLGDEVTLTVTGTIHKLESEPIDVSSFGGRPTILPGASIVGIVVLRAVRVEAATAAAVGRRP
jgi:hypothetical protein